MVLAEHVGAVDGEQLREPRAARLTRLLIVPTAVSQMAAASSWEKPDAPTRMSASRWSGGRWTVVGPTMPKPREVIEAGWQLARKLLRPAEVVDHPRPACHWQPAGRGKPMTISITSEILYRCDET